MAGRLACSFLTTLGMTDLIAQDEDDYLRIAVRLAADRARLVQERETLRERMLASPIANPGCTRGPWKRRTATCGSAGPGRGRWPGGEAVS